MFRAIKAATVFVTILLSIAVITAQDPTPSPLAMPLPSASPAATQRTPDVPFVPTPPEVVDAMLKMAEVTKDDVLYDLGSGDGRIVIAAAKNTARRASGSISAPIL